MLGPEFGKEAGEIVDKNLERLIEGVKEAAAAVQETFVGNRKLEVKVLQAVSPLDLHRQSQLRFDFLPAGQYTFSGLYWSHIRITTKKQKKKFEGDVPKGAFIDKAARPLSGAELEKRVEDHLRARYVKKFEHGKKSKELKDKIIKALASQYEAAWSAKWNTPTKKAKHPHRKKVIEPDLVNKYKLGAYVEARDWAGAAEHVATEIVRKEAAEALRQHYMTLIAERKIPVKLKAIKTNLGSEFEHTALEAVQSAKAGALASAGWFLSTAFPYRVTCSIMRINEVEARERLSRMRERVEKEMEVARDAAMSEVRNSEDALNKRILSKAQARGGGLMGYRDTIDAGDIQEEQVLAQRKARIHEIAKVVSADDVGRVKKARERLLNRLDLIDELEREITPLFAKRFIAKATFESIGAHAGIESGVKCRDTNVKVVVKLTPSPAEDKVVLKLGWEETTKLGKLEDAYYVDGTLDFDAYGKCRGDGGKIASRFLAYATVEGP